jgi:hypothetical protein
MAQRSLDIFQDGHEAMMKHFFVQFVRQMKQLTVATNMLWLDQSAVTVGGQQQRQMSCSDIQSTAEYSSALIRRFALCVKQLVCLVNSE